MFLKGFFYRFGDRVKNAGEIAGHKRRFYAGALVRIGCAVRDAAAKRIRI